MRYTEEGHLTTEAPTTEPVDVGQKPTVAETLWAELGEHNDPIRLGAGLTDDYLESIRSRILEGELPQFIATDYREGWYHYARSEVSDRLIKAFTTVDRRRRRQFIPTALTSPSPWGEAEQQDEETIVQYSFSRLTRHITSAAVIHGAPLADLRGFEFARRVAHKSVDDAFDKLEADSAVAA